MAGRPFLLAKVLAVVELVTRPVAGRLFLLAEVLAVVGLVIRPKQFGGVKIGALTFRFDFGLETSVP